MQACDFSRSFLTFRIDSKVQPSITQSTKPNHTANNPRIQLECICDLTAPGADPVQYVMGASCKTERVNVSGDIWNDPNADFCLTVSDEHFLVIKQYDHCGRKVMLYPPSLGEQPHRQVGLVSEAYARLSIDVHRTEGRELESAQEVIDATLANIPLVAVTEFETDDGFGVRLEYPVKTINAGDREIFYQTDTGPVLFPRQPGGCELPIESFHLAYIAANSPDWAELLVCSPIAVSEEITVLHFHEPVRIECRNQDGGVG